MSKNNNLRVNTGGKILNSVSKAGTTFHDLGPPPGNNLMVEIVNSTPYSNYIDTNTGNMYQKDEKGNWGTDFIRVGAGAAGGITGLEPSGTGISLVADPDVSPGNKGRVLSLTSLDGTVIFTPNGDSLDLEVAGQEKNNFTATRGPNFNDNQSSGYQVGSVWINTALDSGNKSFTCVESSLVSATWKPTSNELYFQADVPNNTQDRQFGFLEGSIIWTPDAQYVCVDDTINQAKWAVFGGKQGEVKWDIRRELNPSLDESYDIQFKNDGDAYKIKNNYNESKLNNNNPTATFDTNARYTIGSEYFTGQFGWKCLDSTANSARWDSSLGMGESLLYNLPSFDPDATYDYKLYLNGGINVANSSFVGSNYRSNRDPTALDSTTLGYDIGSLWFNIVLKKLWIYDASTSDWVWLNQGGSPPIVEKAVAHYGYKYIEGQILPRPTFDGPPINVNMYVPLRLGGAQQGQSQTFTPQIGHNPNSLFVNSNLASENCALQYTGTTAGWFNCTVYLRAIKPAATPLYDWYIQLWSDTTANPLTVSFDRLDAQIENNEETQSNFSSFAAQSVSFLRYFTPNEYIGIVVKAIPNSGSWLTSVDNVSIKIAPV